MKRIFVRVQTRDIATKERPEVYSCFPRSITAFDKVNPWLLCTVIAQARLTGICKREQTRELVFQVHRMGGIGTIFLPSVDIISGPL